MKYQFHLKQDPNQEAIGACEAGTTDEALRFFALTKMLAVDHFQILFGIKEYTHGEGKTPNSQGSKQLLKG